MTTNSKTTNKTINKPTKGCTSFNAEPAAGIAIPKGSKYVKASDGTITKIIAPNGKVVWGK